MAESYNYQRSTFECMDKSPETLLLDCEVRQEPLAHRDFLDPEVEDLLTSGGVELSAPTQMALNLSTKEELLEATTPILVVVATISA